MSNVANRLTIDEGGNLAGNCFVGTGGGEVVFDCLKQYLSIVKSCRDGEQGCFFNDGSSKPYKYLNGDDWWDFDDDGTPKAILSNGMSIRITNPAGDCNADFGDGPADGTGCTDIWVDVNGKDGPNRYGRDVFYMAILKCGRVLPGGSFHFDSEFPNRGSVWASSCDPSAATGAGCLGRILREGDINY